MRKTLPLAVAVVLILSLALAACGSSKPDSVARGEEVAADQGCYGCHGDRGVGGIGNSGSPLDTVPGWQTKAFAEVFGDEDGKPDREKIAFMINEGAEAYYETYMAHDAAAQTIARTISGWERQMPGYKGVLTPKEVEDLVDFIISLNPFFED